MRQLPKHNGAYLTRFEALDIFSQSEQKEVYGDETSSESVLIKTRSPNLLHGCDFLVLT